MDKELLERILVVDDEPNILTVTRLTLAKRGGFVVEAASSGMQALEIAPAFNPHLILLDVMMPGMDGPTTFERLRALDGMAAVPIVFMTAKVQASEIERYLGLGAAGVVAKPFDQRTLVATITELWGGLASVEPAAALERATADLSKEYGVRLPSKISEIEEAWERMRIVGARTQTARDLHGLAYRLTGTGATYGHHEISRVAGELAREIEVLIEREAPFTAKFARESIRWSSPCATPRERGFRPSLARSTPETLPVRQQLVPPRLVFQDLAIDDGFRFAAVHDLDHGLVSERGDAARTLVGGACRVRA